MKFFRDKISNMLGVPIKLGNYIDHSSSLHLYGLYADKDGMREKIAFMKSLPINDYRNTMNLEHFLSMAPDLKEFPWHGEESAKRVLAAQLDAEAKGFGIDMQREGLVERGYDLENFPYPAEWNKWPDSWDKPPITTEEVNSIIQFK